MFCRHCGAEISGTPATCPECGGDVTPLGGYSGNPSGDFQFPGTPTESIPYSGEPAESAPYPGTPDESAPYPGTPAESAPYPGTPTESIPYPGTPAESTPYPGTPTESIPYPGTPAESTPYPGTPTESIPYSGEPAEDFRYPGEPAPEFRYPEPPVSQQPPKRKRWPLLVGLAAGVVVVLLAVILLVVNLGGGKSGGAIEKAVIHARISEDGDAYIPLMDGSVIRITGDVESAAITADRTRVVVLLTDGTLYVTDPELSEKTTVADNAVSFSYVRDDGFFFSDEDDMDYRVLFKDARPMELGYDLAWVVADHTTSVLFATKDGDILALPSTAEEWNRVGTFDSNASVEGISDDGTMCVWVNSDGYDRTIYYHNGEDRFTLDTVNSKYNYTYASFTKDQQLMTVVNTYHDTMWLMTPGEEPVKVKLGAEPSSSTLYTPQGYISDCTTAEATCLYIRTDSDNASNVYCISLDGERDRVLSRVVSMDIVGGTIVYLDDDGTLYCAKLDGASVTDETKLAGDVDMFELSNNGQYVYYMKGCGSDDIGTLYCYKLGTDAPEKIDSDVACWYYSASLSLMDIDISTDGKTVFYCTDPEDVGDTYTSQGTLMMWTYGSEDPTRVASDVIVHSPISGYATGEVNPNAIAFLKVSYYNTDDDIFANWMFFNGTDSQKMASDVGY